MRLLGNGGESLNLEVVGYQFPEAVDPAMRYSWHLVRGAVDCSDGEWPFEMQR